jgi:hypothetical protein
MQAVLLDPAGWHLLLPEKNVKRNFRDAMLSFLLMSLPLVVVLVHLLMRKRDLGFFGWIPVLAVVLVLVFQVIWVVRAWSVSRNMSDPRVLVKPAPLRIGEPFGVKIELDAYSPMKVSKVEAKLVCVEHYQERRGNKTQTGVRDHRTEAMVLAGGDVAAGGMLEREGEWTVTDWPASQPLNSRVYPFYTWEVRLDVAVDGAADYRGVFPLEAV